MGKRSASRTAERKLYELDHKENKMERLQSLLEGRESSHIRPFLWMKGEDREVILEEMEKIEQCGIREICLESRPHPEFCRDSWWDTLDCLLPEAQKRGIRLWILDDDKFPTGHANGGYKRQPEKAKIYLAERHMDIYGPCRNSAVLVENFLGNDGRLLGILAVPKPDGETLAVSGEGILDLTDRYEQGFVYLDLPEGPYRLFVLFTTRKGGGREDYMNLLDADSVRVLIDEVYEKHYARYEKYFGTTIAGFFSDEPELGNVPGYPFDNTLGQRDIRLPWSGELETVLRERWGEEFLTSLPALWYDSGDKTTAVRYTYMDEMTRLVRKNFSGQMGKWCEQHGVEYIGHIIEDDNAHARMGCSIGHYFREMEGQHMAGIDVVHHQIVPGFTEPVHQWIAGDRDGEFFHFGLAKLGSSAAHIQKNKKGRALCEIFGNYGWAEGNSLMKWLTNHMLVRGINEFTPHAFSMRYPDPDCPPHFYARGKNPGFECFTWLMKYMNRCAYLLSGGTPLMDAAILYHAEAEWSGGDCMYFQKPGRKLLERQLDYDVIPVDALGKAKVEEGRLVIGRMKYPCLILPFASHLDAGAAAFVEKAAAKGLKVFQIGSLPERDLRGGLLPGDWACDVEVLGLEDIADAVDQLRKPEAWEAPGKPDKQESCQGGLELVVTGAIPKLRYMRVLHKDSLTAMYFNESVTKSVQAFVRTSLNYRSVTVYDPWNNKAESFAVKEGKIPLCLEPGETVFFCFDLEQPDQDELVQDGQVQGKAVTKVSYPVLTKSEPLCIDWQVSRRDLPEGPFTGETLLKAEKELPNLNGPGYWPAFTGTYRYKGSFQGKKEEGKRYKLLLPEASDSVRILLNGRDCGWAAGFPAHVDITETLLSGENSLVLDVVTTLVWERKDGASTHLQIPATGITKAPVIECYE